MINKHKTLKEAIVHDPELGEHEWNRLVNKATPYKYFNKFSKLLKETQGTLQGDITDESDATAALGEVYNQIVMGVEEHIPLDFARIYNTTKSEIKVPVGTYGVATEISSGGFSAGEKTTSFVTIAIDKEYGVNVSWTRAHLEDATWDVMAEQNQGAGYSIQQILCDKLVAEAKAIALDDLAGDNSVAIVSETAITWAEFSNLLAALDIEGTGPADFVLCSPARYWQLLALDQFVNSLYAGSDEVMRSGIAKTTFGTTVLRVSGLGDKVSLKFSTEDPDFAIGETVTGAGGATGVIVALSRTAADAGTMTLSGVTGTFVDTEALTGSVAGVGVVVGTQYAAKSIMALNSKKALALAYRRNITIEPFEYSDEDRYGFTASVRAKADTVVPNAVSVGMVGTFIEHL